MPESLPKFAQLKPSQLTLPISFPPRENPTPLGTVKEELLEYGFLRPLVVRPGTEGQYVVLDGRRRLQAVWELQDDGHERHFRWLPCYVIHSDGPLTDLKLYLMLNKYPPLSVGEVERTLAEIEKAEAPAPR
jgi:ParB-like chromosome segregation protein Spo0J